MLREWHLSQAVGSVRQLQAVIRELTEAELKKAIELEEGSTRRQSILVRLHRQLRVLARKSAIANL